MIRGSRHKRCAPLARLTIAALLMTTAGVGVAGPTMPEHDGDKYYNPGEDPGHGGFSLRLLGFLLWDILEDVFPRDLKHPPVVPDAAALLREKALPGVPTITWIGHATFLVRMGDVTFLTDPVWSDRTLAARRAVAPPFEIDELPPIDFVVVSHNHPDHMDLDALVKLSEKGARIFVPAGNAETVRAAGATDVEEFTWWQKGTDIKGASVYAVPTRHWSTRCWPFDENEALWSGWVVVANDRRFFFSGDSGKHDWFQEIRERLGPFDLAALGIGAYDPPELLSVQHMSPQEAVEAAIELGTKRSVAMHFGTFDLADEDLDDPPLKFRQASNDRGRNEDQDWILAIGETKQW